MFIRIYLLYGHWALVQMTFPPLVRVGSDEVVGSRPIECICNYQWKKKKYLLYKLQTGVNCPWK